MKFLGIVLVAFLALSAQKANSMPEPIKRSRSLCMDPKNVRRREVRAAKKAKTEILNTVRSKVKRCIVINERKTKTKTKMARVQAVLR